MKQVGLVAIGRNEGQRLRQCLVSATDKVARVVYVDSGSTDGSLELARSLGADTVELDLSIPFTAARARNEGFARLLELAPDIEFVQFVDGDCEVVDGWIDRAYNELAAKPEVAAVCGRRRERYPEASIYNQLCDIEWDTPIGETKACGGDSMMRASAFQQVEGFNPALIAGEEPETVRAVAPKRLENPPLRCRNDPARRANDQFRSVVETRSKSGSRLRRGLLDARKRTGAPLGQRNPQHLVLGLSLASPSLGNDMADKRLELVTIDWLPLSNLSHL
ncbi:glycosyltransferase family A protein [Microcoleus vaginatus]|uniref:glycosyltransferase family A protein n=1 Tax=Microcoleus vaginatus TaxID=119532 RepID=UPI00403F8090